MTTISFHALHWKMSLLRNITKMTTNTSAHAQQGRGGPISTSRIKLFHVGTIFFLEYVLFSFKNLSFVNPLCILYSFIFQKKSNKLVFATERVHN